MRFSLLALAAAAAVASSAFAAPPQPESAGAQRLAAMQAALAPRLAAAPTPRPLLIESSEQAAVARGDIYAVLPHPYATLVAALREPAQWCEAFELHLYVRGCSAGPPGLTLQVVTRHDAPADGAHALALAFSREVEGSGYVRTQLRAARGPLGTRDYEIVFEAVPAGPSASFVHFGYQAGASMMGQWALQAYLATRGRDKVGFSAAPGDDRPGTIRGTRGVVERNAMRYELAIEAYLDSLALPEPARRAHRLAAWFDATERYPRQLHEVERADYLAAKSRAAAPAIGAAAGDRLPP
ncbi:hypothetical protein [Aquabacterium humicola]|uniref:hypothetical protein n=1 Tax=Aquabacterium humicola TaxID=3237377 RepID=UPI002543CEBA|nr:hypothetical protein [Rubrivivax pictus]